MLQIPLSINKTGFRRDADLKESITNAIEMLLQTPLGANPSDPHYGFIFNNFRFEIFNEDEGTVYESVRDTSTAAAHNAYYDKKIYENDPFAKLDQTGVGKLVAMAVKDGHATRPDLHCGICGEHGGDPASVEFCHKVGLDYVSCSPFRVPIARLAAAQAAINNPETAECKCDKEEEEAVKKFASKEYEEYSKKVAEYAEIAKKATEEAVAELADISQASWKGIIAGWEAAKEAFIVLVKVSYFVAIFVKIFSVILLLFASKLLIGSSNTTVRLARSGLNSNLAKKNAKAKQFFSPSLNV